MSKTVDENIKPTHIGGQALIEGIMMRGKYNWAVAVRKPDGTIYTEEHDLASGKEKNKWMTWPIVRGCVAFAEAMALSFRALEIAANHAFSEDGETSASSEPVEAAIPAIENTEIGDEVTEVLADAGVDANDAVEIAADPSSLAMAADEALSAKEIAVALVGGIGLAILLFMVLPAFLTDLLVGPNGLIAHYEKATFVWNVVDGVLRVAAFVIYIWVISLLSDVKRMFGYHGAEHKTIHAFERGKDLTLDSVRPYSTLHVRCGTAFMLMSMIIAIVVFTIVPVRPLIESLGVQNQILFTLLVILSRLILIPVIAGIAYEVTVKWAGSRSDNPLVKIILWPGLQLQKLTTNEPDDGMLECALAATELIVAREDREDHKPEVAEVHTTDAES